MAMHEVIAGTYESFNLYKPLPASIIETYPAEARPYVEGGRLEFIEYMEGHDSKCNHRLTETPPCLCGEIGKALDRFYDPARTNQQRQTSYCCARLMLGCLSGELEMVSKRIHQLRGELNALQGEDRIQIRAVALDQADPFLRRLLEALEQQRERQAAQGGSGETSPINPGEASR